jgi:hypothetical protein
MHKIQGAGSPRPQRWQCLHRKIAPLGRQTFFTPMIMLSLGLSTAVRCGRTECVPPRKPPLAPSPGLPRKAISPPPRPPRRGGLRTPATTELASPEHVAIWPPGIRLPPVIMLCPGSHPALPRGRTECVPPRKPPSASSPGLPRKAVSPPPRPPRRGGLRTPVITPLASPRHVPARPPGPTLAWGGHAIRRVSLRPRYADAETAPLRGNHLRAIRGPSSARPSHPRMVPPRRGGLRTPVREA